MFIRVAQPKDIETLFEIRTSVTENYQSRAEIAKLGITPESIAVLLQESCCAWIAEVDHHAIGFAIADQTEESIFGIFVRPGYEGRGAGRQLMAAAENWLRQNGTQQAWLITGNDPTLRAYGFYLHLGWRTVGVLPDGVFKGEMKFVKDL